MNKSTRILLTLAGLVGVTGAWIVIDERGRTVAADESAEEPNASEANPDDTSLKAELDGKTHSDQPHSKRSIAAANSQPTTESLEPKRMISRARWLHSIEGTAEELALGMPDLETLADLIDPLLESALSSNPEAWEDGTTAYTAADLDDLGSARLHVRSGQAGHDEEFELRIAMTAPVGGWNADEAGGSNLVLNFDVSQEGSLEGLRARLETPVSSDANELARHEGELPPTGSMLFVDSNSARWHQVQLELIERQDGSLNRSFAISDPVVTQLGGPHGEWGPPGLGKRLAGLRGN